MHVTFATAFGAALGYVAGVLTPGVIRKLRAFVAKEEQAIKTREAAIKKAL